MGWPAGNRGSAGRGGRKASVTILDLLNRDQCPLINGLYLDDGTLIALNYENRGDVHFEVTDILNFDAIDIEETGVCDFAWYGQHLSAEHVVRYGEGSYGSDGVAGLFCRRSQKIIWFLFLDNSNPFCDARLSEDTVFLHTTSGAIFSIPIKQPQNISVVKGPDFL
jgi:hypothetical protein